MIALVGLVVVGAIVLLVVATYNSLQGLRIRSDNAWSDIDVQLKRRHDLIPNLVETVKGYAAHEKGTFENVAKFRSMAMSATTTADRVEAEGQLTMALRGLLAVAEQYPQLQASQQFRDLSANLASLESDIQNSRRYYNAVVRDLNTKIAVFPSNVIAGMFHFQPRQFFEVSDPSQREPVPVKF
jgi:LemA protein